MPTYYSFTHPITITIGEQTINSMPTEDISYRIEVPSSRTALQNTFEQWTLGRIAEGGRIPTIEFVYAFFDMFIESISQYELRIFLFENRSYGDTFETHLDNEKRRIISEFYIRYIYQGERLWRQAETFVKQSPPDDYSQDLWG